MRSTIIVVTAAIAAMGCAETPKPPAGNVYDIVGTDYAFQAPKAVPAGRVAFRFVNNGKMRHELNVTVLKKGVSIEDYVRTHKGKDTVRPLIEGTGGVLFAKPGESSSSLLTLDIEEGATLGVICIFRDSAGKPRHYDMGMYTTITGTKAVASAPVPQQPTDTIIATEYAFQYPRELAAGRHTFVLKNAGTKRHEINIGLLKEGVTLADLLAAEKAGEKVGPLFDKGMGVLHVYGGQSPKGQLSFEVEPGREYLIGCYFKDDDKSPEHYSMGMYGSMKGVAAVTGAPK